MQLNKDEEFELQEVLGYMKEKEKEGKGVSPSFVGGQNAYQENDLVVSFYCAECYGR